MKRYVLPQTRYTMKRFSRPLMGSEVGMCVNREIASQGEKTLEHEQVAEKHLLRRLFEHGQMQGTRNPEE